MGKRDPTDWRPWAAAAAFLTLLLGAIFVIRLAPSPEKQVPEIDVQPSASPPIASPERPLDRAALIDAANKAADAAASGAAFPEDLAVLAGRRFVLRMPFGCGVAGGQNESTSSYWSYDDARQTLRASVTPESWSDDDRIFELAEPLAYEAAEGFWISRPWIRSGDCPLQPEAMPEESNQLQGRAAVGSGPASRSPIGTHRETLGIVEFFPTGSPRAARRSGRPYTLSVKMDPEKVDLSDGLRLVVEGRLAAFPNGRPIACRVDNIELRPVCMIRVEVGKVAITDASGEATLAEWND